MTDHSLTADDTGPPFAEAAVPLSVDLTDVFHANHERLLRIAYLLCGDHRLAEDVVADAFAKSIPHLARRRIDDPAAYLRRAVVNGVKSQFGRRTRERRHQAQRLRPTTATPFEDTSAERARLLHALDQLPARQRAVVVLRYFDDRSEAEVAAVLGIRPGTVKTHTHRALTTLRTELREIS